MDNRKVIAGEELFASSVSDFMTITDRIIRGRTAENILSEMLREAGYSVYRFGYEGILQNFAQKGLPRMKAKTVPAEKIRSMPDFIVMNKEGDVFFIEVKYRHNGENDQYFKEWLRKAVKYWPEAKVLLLHPYEPCFQISTIIDYVKTKKFYPLEQDKFIKVSKSLVVQYGEMVKKYLI